MSDSNRVRLTHIRETTLGVTPTPTPRMRRARFTGEQLRFRPKFVQSEEIRDDRMNSDPIKVGEDHQGPINCELSYPVDKSPRSDWFESLFCSTWSNTPLRDNDGTADSVITDVAATGGVITVTTGAAFVAGHLVRTTGFAQSANNAILRCSTGSATVPAFASQGLVNEAAPAASARMKVVGFQGASGDITATASGLGSTALNFTTLGLAVGQWVKIGGTASGDKFATAACNSWARITAIAAAALTLDNLPSGWATDSGTGKTIKVWFGDQIKNGTTVIGQTLERGFMSQAVPTYLIERGMVAGQYEATIASEQVIKDVFTFSGLTGDQATTSLDASPDAASTNPIMAANVNVGRISENGSAVGSPNWVREMSIRVNNNVRMKTDVETPGAVDIGLGEFMVQVTLRTYFGSNSLLAKLYAGTATNISSRVTKDGQALVFSVPRITFTDGAPNASAKNQDVELPLESMASVDALTNAHLLLDRLEYFEI